MCFAAHCCPTVGPPPNPSAAVLDTSFNLTHTDRTDTDADESMQTLATAAFLEKHKGTAFHTWPAATVRACLPLLAGVLPVESPAVMPGRAYKWIGSRVWFPRVGSCPAGVANVMPGPGIQVEPD